MASSDPTTASSSAEIFSGTHTLPQIRAIHSSLHVQIEEKAGRLRTQVGGSYRELLRTADTIVQMRGDNDDVQQLLGRIGSRCGRSVLSTKASSLRKFYAREDKTHVAEAARLRLLNSCLQVTGRILKSGNGSDPNASPGSLLILAAKVLVLSRLLVKTLEEESQSTRARRAVKSSRQQMIDLRQQLSNAVEHVLSTSDDRTSREDIVRALAAHCLVNSSGVKDALQHLLRIRAMALAAAFEDEDDEREKGTEAILHSMNLYIRTLLDVQALVPVKMAQALSSLRKQPLLADDSLKQLEGLRLDILERWCGDDVQCFTPFLRHDDLDGKLARESLHDWAEKGGERLVDGLRKILSRSSDIKAIVDLRFQILQLWIRDGGKAKGLDPSELQADLRTALNERTIEVLDSKVNKIKLIGSEVRATLESWRSGISDKREILWDEDGFDSVLSIGAVPFIQEVASRLYGRNDAVSRAITSYQSWHLVIGEVRTHLDQLRLQRWDNDFDEIEDEETIEARQRLLSREDPEMLEKRLNASLDKAFQELHTTLHQCWVERQDLPSSGGIAMYLIRILRDVRYQLPERKEIQGFGLEMFPLLQERVVDHILSPILEAFFESGLRDLEVVGRPLWEGEPPSPNHPSPKVFMLLRDVSGAMGDVGDDLWTPSAVSILKRKLSQGLCETWTRALKQLSDQPAEAEGEDSDKPELGSSQNLPSDLEKREIKIQWLFDIQYLQCSMGTLGIKDGNDLEKVKSGIEKDLEDVSEIAHRIEKSSQDLWQRTNLLFGLLV